MDTITEVTSLSSMDQKVGMTEEQKVLQYICKLVYLQD